MPASSAARDQRFHAWRKAVKELMYGLEAWPKHGHRQGRRLITRLNRLQERLGEANDLRLRETSRGAPALDGKDFGRGKGKELTRKKNSLKRKSLKLGRKILAASPGEFRRMIA
jgi:hypothetical protein